MTNNLPNRKQLPHQIPSWVNNNSIFFVTICTNPRGVNQLCNNNISLQIWNSALYYINIHKWWVHYFLLMPDHRLRDNKSFERKAEYISMNPVRAGFIDKPEQWPYYWGFDNSGRPIR